MKHKTGVTVFVASVLALTSLAGFAQDRPRDRTQADRNQQVDRTGDHDA